MRPPGLFELCRMFYGTEEYSELAKMFRRVYTTLVADQNASLGGFSFRCNSKFGPGNFWSDRTKSASKIGPAGHIY